MVEVPVFYATTEGQTRRIAEHMAQTLRAAGYSSMAIDVAGTAAAMLDWRCVRAAIVGASVHVGQHQKTAAEFVAAHRTALNTHPSAFFSVSMGAASKNPKEVDAVRQLAAAFLDQAQWHPDAFVSIAGRIAYKQYGFLTRYAMRWIAWREGGPTDTSRDHEFTNWQAVDRFVEQFTRTIHAAEHPLAS